MFALHKENRKKDRHHKEHFPQVILFVVLRPIDDAFTLGRSFECIFIRGMYFHDPVAFKLFSVECSGFKMDGKKDAPRKQCLLNTSELPSLVQAHFLFLNLICILRIQRIQCIQMFHSEYRKFLIVTRRTGHLYSSNRQFLLARENPMTGDERLN